MNSFLDNRPTAARKNGSTFISNSEPGFHSLIARNGSATPTPVSASAPKPPPAAETEPTPQVELIENAGRVERIERRGRDWAVVTNQGYIGGAAPAEPGYLSGPGFVNGAAEGDFMRD